MRLERSADVDLEANRRTWKQNGLSESGPGNEPWQRFAVFGLLQHALLTCCRLFPLDCTARAGRSPRTAPLQLGLRLRLGSRPHRCGIRAAGLAEEGWRRHGRRGILVFNGDSDGLGGGEQRHRDVRFASESNPSLRPRSPASRQDSGAGPTRAGGRGQELHNQLMVRRAGRGTRGSRAKARRQGRTGPG